MTAIPEDVEVRVASEAAQKFVDAYYAALNSVSGRSSLTTFYIKPTVTSPLQADISLNGNIVATPDELQALFEKQVSKAHYEVQSFDCQVLNTNYNIDFEDHLLSPDKDGKKMSVLVVVSGSVKYGKEGGSEGNARGFTESIVLVPNWAAQGPKALKGERRWLIQSQNFRLVL